MRINCDQCQAVSINGVPCHEQGCPNARKTWVYDEKWDEAYPADEAPSPDHDNFTHDCYSYED